MGPVNYFINSNYQMLARPINYRPMGYVPSLDGLRCIAVLVVMFLHAHFQLGKSGSLGVDIFFTLSGFLITTLLLEEYAEKGGICLKAFFTRRFFRLFPALYLLLTILTIYLFLFLSGSVRNAVGFEILSSALYINNISWLWGWGNQGLLLGHTWSLAVEEQFYIIWPLVLMVFIHLRFTKALLGLLFMTVLFSWIGKSNDIAGPILASLLHESIMIGCLGALMRWYRMVNGVGEIVTLSSVMFLVIVGVFPFDFYQTLFDLGLRGWVAVITVIAIFGLLEKPTGITSQLLGNRVFVFIGKISYGLYLWHVPIFRLFKSHAHIDPTTAFLLKFVVVFGVSSLSWFLIEKKCTMIGRNLSRRIQQKAKQSLFKVSAS